MTQKMFKTFKNEKNYFRIVHNSKKVKNYFFKYKCVENLVNERVGTNSTIL